MRKSLFFSIILICNASFAQKFFKLEGEISNRTEPKIIITVYRNWVEEPEDFYVSLDIKNHFYFEIALDEPAYLDINYGNEGLLFWIAEPDDNIHLKFDALKFTETFLPTGKGSAKWVFNHNYFKEFENEKDWDYEMARSVFLKKSDFTLKVDSLEKAQLDFLNQYKSKLSETFFILKRADILGKTEMYRLEYLVKSKTPNNILIKSFNTDLINENTQELSFEYGNFIESFLEALKNNSDSSTETNLDEYVFLKNCFAQNLVKRSILERILTNRIISYLENEGYNPETELITGSFKEFAKNNFYKNLVLSKFTKMRALQKGFEAPPVVFTDNMGKLFSLKDLHGKYVYIMVWSSTCGPCAADLKQLSIIENYFSSKTDLFFLNVAVDSNLEYLTFMKDREVAGKSIRIETSSRFLKDYEITYLPAFFLIDKNGMLIDQGMIEPSHDEGRGLIKYLEKVLVLKTK